MRRFASFAVIVILISMPALLFAQGAFSENTKLPHLRIYLSSLLKEAEPISTLSPLQEEEIISLTQELLTVSEVVMDDTGEAELLKAFDDVYTAIFANENLSVDAFRQKAAHSLRDIQDALPLLIEEQTLPVPLLHSTQNELSKQIDVLIAALVTVSQPHEILGWLKEFEALANALHTYVPLPPMDQLRDDLRELMSRLNAYLRSNAEMQITSPRSEERVRELEEALEHVASPEDALAFIILFEQMIGDLPTTPLPPVNE